MKTNKFNTVILALVFSILLISCNNDDNGPVNEEEVITTVKVELVNGGNTITLLSRDLDGDGPNAPIISVSGNLATGTTYTGTTTILNELETPAENITEEVQTEGEEHQLFYQLPTSIGTISYSDFDSSGKPIGLNFILTTGASTSSGNISVVLRHLPNKDAEGVVNGNITNAGGSTDAQVVFPVSIQ